MAIDRYGRVIDYLRISLTDHCNLRCIYCSPEEAELRQCSQLMTDHEVITICRSFANIGFKKFRLTGGEPTIRKGIVDLVREISNIPGIKMLTMTTNGVLFTKLAFSLAEAGLTRVNFSLDTLDVNKFHRLTGKNYLPEVLEGINAAEKAGLLPIKINVVVMRDYNEDDIAELARLTINNPWHVRFIEVMPLGNSAEFQLEQIVSAAEIRKRLKETFNDLEIINHGILDGETRLYRIPCARGVIGIISSVTENFCSSCNRIRITADGHLRLCLLRDNEIDILTPIRNGIEEDELSKLIKDAIWDKPWGNALALGLIPQNKRMSAIGG